MSARLLVVAGAVLWGTTGTAQALGPEGTAPAAVGALRIAVGAVGLALVAGPLRLAADAGWWTRPGRRVPALAAMAAIGAYQACFFAAVARTGVAVGTVVAIGSAPAFTGLLGLLIRGERPERRWPVATVLAVAGCAVLVLPGGEAAVDPFGVTLALGAGLAYATYTVAGKQLLETGAAPTAVMAVVFGGGALLLLPVVVAGDVTWLADPRGVAMVAWLGLVATTVSYVLFARGLRRLPAATAATLSLAEPLTAGILGVVVLAERPGVPGALGAGLIAAGLVWLSARRPHRSG